MTKNVLWSRSLKTLSAALCIYAAAVFIGGMFRSAEYPATSHLGYFLKGQYGSTFDIGESYVLDMIANCGDSGNGITLIGDGMRMNIWRFWEWSTCAVAAFGCLLAVFALTRFRKQQHSDADKRSVNKIRLAFLLLAVVECVRILSVLLYLYNLQTPSDSGNYAVRLASCYAGRFIELLLIVFALLLMREGWRGLGSSEALFPEAKEGTRTMLLCSTCLLAAGILGSFPFFWAVVIFGPMLEGLVAAVSLFFMLRALRMMDAGAPQQCETEGQRIVPEKQYNQSRLIFWVLFISFLISLFNSFPIIGFVYDGQFLPNEEIYDSTFYTNDITFTMQQIAAIAYALLFGYLAYAALKKQKYGIRTIGFAGAAILAVTAIISAVLTFIHLYNFYYYRHEMNSVLLGLAGAFTLIGYSVGWILFALGTSMSVPLKVLVGLQFSVTVALVRITVPAVTKTMYNNGTFDGGLEQYTYISNNFDLLFSFVFFLIIWFLLWMNSRTCKPGLYQLRK